MTGAPDIATLSQLRASGHEQKSLRRELRDNLLAKLAAGEDPWPGLHGFEQTVLPQVERALIAGHDIVLLGERGQGKTRLLRTLVGLLDEWTPVIEGSELGEHPYEPITPRPCAAPRNWATTFRSPGGTARAVCREARHPGHQSSPT
jgi:magnesium chelatase subunit I